MTDDSSMFTIRDLRDSDIAIVQDLWERCGLLRPWHDPDADVRLAMENPSSTILVGERDGRLIATALCGFDGHRGWVYRVAVEPDCRGGGIGRQIMVAAEEWLRERGAPKVMLMVRSTNKDVTAFYDQLGYAPEELVIMSRWLDDDLRTRRFPS